MKTKKIFAGFSIFALMSANLFGVQFSGDKTDSYTYNAPEGEDVVLGYQGSEGTSWNPLPSDYSVAGIMASGGGSVYVGYSDGKTEQPLTGTINGNIHAYAEGGESKLFGEVYFSNAAQINGQVNLRGYSNVYFKNSGHMLHAEIRSANGINRPLALIENSGNINRLSLYLNEYEENQAIYADGSAVTLKAGSYTGSLDFAFPTNMDITIEKGATLGSIMAVAMVDSTLHFGAQKYELYENFESHSGLSEKTFIFVSGYGENIGSNVIKFDVESPTEYGSLHTENIMFSWMGEYATDFDIELNVTALESDFSIGDELVLFHADNGITGSFDFLEGDTIMVDGFEEIMFEIHSTANDIIAVAVAIPEPSTYAALFGALALGFVAYRRRGKK